MNRRATDDEIAEWREVVAESCTFTEDTAPPENSTASFLAEALDALEIERENADFWSDYVLKANQLMWRLWRSRREYQDAEHDSTMLWEMQVRILERVCLALKGPPPPLVMYSLHDLGEVAEYMMERMNQVIEYASENECLTCGLADDVLTILNGEVPL